MSGRLLRGQRSNVNRQWGSGGWNEVGERNGVGVTVGSVSAGVRMCGVGG